MGKLRVFDVLWIFVIVMSHTSSEEMLPKPNLFFFGEEAVNASGVTWAHAVNSVELLEEALKGDVMMLEADVLMGTKEGSSEIVPIMAHPPAQTSNLSFQDFVERVLDFVGSSSKVKKGIKLDFKDIKAVEPSLIVLERLSEKIKFPVWLNADVLPGPVNSTGTPVDKDQFLNLTQTYFPTATLSLGWTTNYGCNTRGGYDKSHIDEMIDLLSDLKNKNLHFGPTFPVRAGLAAETENSLLLNLVASFPQSTLTLWGSENDPVDMEKLQTLIDYISLEKVYIDVPFDLSTGPGNVCGNRTDSSDSPDSIAPSVDNDTSGSSAPSNYSFCLLMLLTVISVYCMKRFF